MIILRHTRQLKWFSMWNDRMGSDVISTKGSNPVMENSTHSQKQSEREQIEHNR